MFIPIWVFVILIVTNVFTILLLVALINLTCYAHDMIKVSIDMRKEERKLKKAMKTRQEDNDNPTC